MKFELRKHGDPLERHYAALVEARLPAYAELWADFIGNDGSSQLPAQDALAKPIAATRLLVSQYTYTAFEAVACAEHLRESAFANSIGTLATKPGILSYIDAINILIGFFAHIGRVRDSLEKLANKFGDGELWAELDEYYKQRSNVLHNAKVPGAIVQQVLEVVPPEGIAHDPQKWGKRSSWADIALVNAVPLPLLLDQVLNDVLPKLNNAFARLRADHLEKQLGAVKSVLAGWVPPDSAESLSISVTAFPISASGQLKSTVPSGSAQTPVPSLDVGNAKLE